ncbi:7736_t:CDS:2 [Paraglomus brasilianum]|uniref:7736_t:CDS:1 n=1 Tax=Paraglomus brasilianum TaxID=144538 RepID=A0A9N8WI37_9GLOM|nr:7736_t:CDS:2 [Paraglomus brasilianum]
MARSSTSQLLPPITTFQPTQPQRQLPSPPILPPVSCLAPPIPSVVSPPSEFPNEHKITSPYMSQLSSYIQSPPTAKRQVEGYDRGNIQRHPPPVDPATELLAEKRRRNAGASARFRDRRKQREKEMQEKCQFLEKRIQKLEGLDSVKKINELEKKLEEANKENQSKLKKIKELESQIEQLRSEADHSYEIPTPSPSSGDHYVSNGSVTERDDFDRSARQFQSPNSPDEDGISNSETSPSADAKVAKLTDVRSLLLP